MLWFGDKPGRVSGFPDVTFSWFFAGGQRGSFSLPSPGPLGVAGGYHVGRFAVWAAKEAGGLHPGRLFQGVDQRHHRTVRYKADLESEIYSVYYFYYYLYIFLTP